MTNTTSPQIRASAKELEIKLKSSDEDRWLASRCAPKAKRDKIVALYSLVHELERALGVSEPMLGRIRVQWWREVLEQIFSGGVVRSHDLAFALKDEFGDMSNMKPMLDELLNAYDDVLDGVENADKPPRMETGAWIALCAAKVLDQEAGPYEDAIAACGRGYISARIGSPCAAPRLEAVQQAFPTIPPAFGSAVLYVATMPAYMTGKGISALGRRWSIFKAMASGKISKL
ncbi:squalene/phytoene synthase family protein [Hirschia litorea]|uniref:Squalene/phytoene synthase family protein n=1 Tax=Hirschia litorea TaxID=1199156 RepID=A0ABW2IGZ4_9PROT